MNKGIIDNLYSKGFQFKKKLGQNFITDTNLLTAIVRDADIGANDIVLEVGSGAGTLTMAIAKVAKEVHTFEIDTTLQPFLEQAFGQQANITLHFQDVLKLTDEQIKSIIPDKFVVVANIPYYITTQLLMRFIESTLCPTSITVTVQKEVARRIVASPGSPDYGALTLACALWGDAKMVRIVKKDVFTPKPKVDSAVVKITYNPKFSSLLGRVKVSKLIKSAFHMRRKTLINNLSADFGLPKDRLAQVLAEYNIGENTRGEQLALSTYILLSKNNIFD